SPSPSPSLGQGKVIAGGRNPCRSLGGASNHPTLTAGGKDAQATIPRMVPLGPAHVDGPALAAGPGGRVAGLPLALPPRFRGLPDRRPALRRVRRGPGPAAGCRHRRPAAAG